MYSSSRGSNAGYGGQQQQQQQQQPYSSQSAYSQNLGAPYSVGGPEGSSQLSMVSRHSSMLSGSKESDLPGYRGHASAGGPYGGQYSSVYGSASGHQVPGISGKGAPPALEGRIGYASAIPDSPKYASGDYVSSSSHGYGQKSDPLYADKNSDYPSLDRRQYGERQSAYAGRDLQSVPTSRYGDSLSFGRQHQADIFDRMDQASLLRQEILKSQSLQSASLDSVTRQADYLSTRGASAHHATQDLIGYSSRAEADPRNLSYGAPSILGAAPPKRNTEDLIYSSNPGYGISLPPGRDYASGKGLHGVSLDSDYPSSILADRVGYARELDIREEERRRELLREREKDRERDKARERERDRERERERDRERERERDRDRERDRERDRAREKTRERERERERREKDKDRERTRERSLSKVSKDRAERGGSSLGKDAKPTRKESPRREASHRRPSPVREKRREYVCKVHSSSLVESERDYVSLDKRYPRLFISPQCSKVVVRWPRENLRLSIHTPVSFEHNFVGEDAGVEQKEHLAMPIKSESPMVVWNAKMILMSGLSQNALEELSSDRSYDDRIPHYCNMLRFAILKRDNAFMAIGGQWDAVDGEDPSVDESSLVNTLVRHAKDVTQLDLKNCRNWNRFLEIHYERIGKDGMFSHKEVTVLYVPDLSDCLPSLEAWRDQWFAHKKAIAERERQLALKKDKPREKKGGTKDKESESHKKEKGDVKSEKQAEPTSVGEAVNDKTRKNDNEEKEKAAAVVEVVKPDKVDGEDVQNKEAGGSASGVTPGKKKIIKKVVKQKVGSEKKEVLEDPSTVSNKMEISAPKQDEPSVAAGDGVKTFTRKKVGKKVTESKSESHITPHKELETEAEVSKTDTGGATAVVQDATVKKVIKKKVIKRVLKKKTPPAGADEAKNEDNEGVKTVVEGAGEVTTVAKLEESKRPSKPVTSEKASGSSAVPQNKVDKEEKVDEKKRNEKTGKEEKSKEKEKSKDEVKKDQKEKEVSKSKVRKEVKEKKLEELPRHPGLFLQTKGGKDSKLRSISLSLDSLLDYTDKDIDESTFELSLFAESLQEMLQYQMGSRLLTFLQKLRIKFVMKRNQRKRQREEASKENEKKSSSKRLKTDEAKTEDAIIKTEKDEAAPTDDGKSEVKEEAANSVDGTENGKEEEETTDVDDPEEDPEEDEEMLDESSQHDSANDGKDSGEKVESDTKVKMEVEISEDKKQDTNKENAASEPVPGSASKENVKKSEKKKKETAVVDKELLEAFRFFDRNRVGYIRVEDLRLIVHNLGKFLSHRDVKELVQSALLESNTGRDDHILYPKLVRMADI